LAENSLQKPLSGFETAQGMDLIIPRGIDISGKDDAAPC
jgi:hypothetical protein